MSPSKHKYCCNTSLKCLQKLLLAFSFLSWDNEVRGMMSVLGNCSWLSFGENIKLVCLKMIILCNSQGSEAKNIKIDDSIPSSLQSKVNFTSNSWLSQHGVLPKVFIIPCSQRFSRMHWNVSQVLVRLHMTTHHDIFISWHFRFYFTTG